MRGRFRKTVLDNGVRVVTESMSHVRSVSLGVWITAGSRHEPARRSGVSHMLEHMAFKGTARRSTAEIASSLESLGGHLNAFTEKEFTCYCALVLDAHLPAAVDVIADLLQHPRLDPADLDSEKRIVGEEIRNVEDTPEDSVHDRFIQTVFSGHPIGLPILGSEKSVQRISRADLVEQRAAVYTFDRCIVAAAGHLDHGRLVRIVDRAVRHLSERKSGPAEKAVPGRVRRGTAHAPISQTHLCTGVPGLTYSDPRKFALLALDAYFGGGMSSRLFQNLREDKGLAYSVYSFLDFWSDAGLWGVYTGTAPDSAGRALEAVREEQRRLVSGGMTAEALEQVKAQITGNLLLMYEDPGHRMTRLARMEAYTGTFVSLDSVLGNLRAVTQRSVHDVAGALLDGVRPYTVTLEPSCEPA